MREKLPRCPPRLLLSAAHFYRRLLFLTEEVFRAGFAFFALALLFEAGFTLFVRVFDVSASDNSYASSSQAVIGRLHLVPMFDLNNMVELRL